MGRDQKILVAGVGELLWDIFPSGRRIGGAPANFAAHCMALGSDARVLSKIGDDEDGQALLAEIKKLGLPSDTIMVDADMPTGTVNVVLDHEMHPSYVISEDVSWDYLLSTPELEVMAAKFDAICFGTLAQRNEVSRQTIQKLVASTPINGLRIFDVNLRQHYFSPEIVERSLSLANVFKLSDEELPVICQMLDVHGEMEEQLLALMKRFNLEVVALTRGRKGSILVTPEDKSISNGENIEVVDTVGAGDSFTAALCLGLLKNLPLDKINSNASRIAAYVCSQTGAIPLLPRYLHF
ncbi:MAG: carbohydrate kinase [Deltaproteobacteria bacterium]|nr:carbohydrate kinase [Deltaproteobacteria bacterium]